ncbi:carbohydrate ABC transporter permease [Propionibacteriaceae bacterium Y1685]|uniref:carbohydrate ABC transporter permease n=1 Tax=Microlunatus sp. Y1700 TaxID=3418487 RepID=UPI003B77025D
MAAKERLRVRIPRTIVGLLFAVVALLPIIWMALSGFKPNNEVTATPLRVLPSEWMVSNYTDIATDPTFLRAMAMTGLGAVLFTAGTLAINSMAAYVFARLEFTGKTVLWVIAIGTMFIPSMAILLTSFVMVTRLQMLDTLAVLVLPGLASAGQMFFMRQFYLSVPIALEEAAMIDGAGRWRIYLNIFLPMSQPVFVVVGVISFMAYWNGYVWPIMTITTEDLFVIQQYLANFRSERSPERGLLMAGSLLAALPVIVLVVIFQRKIIGNIKIAGLK